VIQRAQKAGSDIDLGSRTRYDYLRIFYTLSNLDKNLLETRVSPEKYNSTGSGDCILTFSYSENIFDHFTRFLSLFLERL
jgi:hypothetical protein